MLGEYSVCHEQISVLINVLMKVTPCLVLVEHSVGSNTNIALDGLHDLTMYNF